MTPNPMEFRRGAVAPMECLKEGWATIKDQYWLFLGICVVGMLVGSAFAIVLMGPMMCGIFLSYLQHMRGERVTFEGLFKGFDYFGQSIIATLIQAIPALLIIVPIYLVMVVGMVTALSSSPGHEGQEAFMSMLFVGMGVMFAAIILFSIIAGIFFMFTFPLIVDRRLSGLQAVKTSVRAGLGNFSGVLGLTLLNALLSFGATFLCYIPGLLVLPITLAAQAIAYRRVFPDIGPVNMAPPPPPGSWAA